MNAVSPAPTSAPVVFNFTSQALRVVMREGEPWFVAADVADALGYACRPGKGTHKGADRAQAMLRKVKREHGHVFVLKADISKFFYSIDHGAIKSLVRRRIACKRTLSLIDNIIDSTATPGDQLPVGLPIGKMRRLYSQGKVSMEKIGESVKSWIAHASHAESYGLRKKLLGSASCRSLPTRSIAAPIGQLKACLAIWY